MTIPSTATLTEKEWKTVLKDKLCKDVEKTGISEQLRNYEKYRRKDLNKAGDALSELKKKIKTAQGDYATIKPLVTYLDKLYAAAQDAQAEVAKRNKTMSEFRETKLSTLLQDKEYRQIIKAYSRKALFEEELDFLLLCGKADSEAIKAKIWTAYIQSNKIDVSKHDTIQGTQIASDFATFLRKFDAICAGFEEEIRTAITSTGFNNFLTEED